MLKSYIDIKTWDKVILQDGILEYKDLPINIGGNVPFGNALDSKEKKEDVMHTMPEKSWREEKTTSGTE